MLAAYLISYYLLPHSLNNHRPKILHNTSLFLISIFMLVIQLVFYLVPKTNLKVLGYAANIPVEEVVRLTNEKRAQAGLTPLNVNPELSAAAKAKGEHMLALDYWAHVAPDGTDPWKFFKDVGYSYRYAGENLARDFSSAQGAVDAWMASQSHKDNLLSSKYQETGIAVVEGDLAGVDTTFIVQLFGTRQSAAPQIAPVAEAKTQVAETVSTPQPTQEAVVITETKPQTTEVVEDKPVSQVSSEKISQAKNPILISPFTATRNMSLATIGLLMGVLVLDAFLISRRNIVRIAGRSIAHISFFGMVFAVILILKAGQII